MDLNHLILCALSGIAFLCTTSVLFERGEGSSGPGQRAMLGYRYHGGVDLAPQQVSAIVSCSHNVMFAEKVNYRIGKKERQ